MINAPDPGTVVPFGDTVTYLNPGCSENNTLPSPPAPLSSPLTPSERTGDCPSG